MSTCAGCLSKPLVKADFLEDESMKKEFRFSTRAAQMAKSLPEIGDSLSHALADLGRHPTPERCELMRAKLRAGVDCVDRLDRELRDQEGSHVP